MSSQTESVEIKTENLVVNLVRKPGCIIHLNVHVSPAGTKAAHAKAIKVVNKEISIPGFRKGKAPESIVVQQFGKHVLNEWKKILVNTAFYEFLQQTHLYPLTTSQNSIRRAEVKSNSLENGADLIFEYEAKPDVPSIDCSSIEIEDVKREAVTEEEVKETIRQLQLKNASWTSVTDRPVQEGDFIELTIDAIEHPPRNICQNMLFEVAEGKMGTWMRRLVVGHSIDEIVEGISEKEPDSQIPDFVPTHCRIKINAIKTAEIPPLDDELAKKFGLKTIEELHPRVEKDLNKRADAEAQDMLRAQIEGFLLGKYDFDIPISIIQKQKDELIDKRVEELSRREEKPEAMIEMTREIEASVEQELTRAYRLFFLTKKIAKENNIQVHENEIMNEMMRQIMLPKGQGIADLSMDPEELRSKLFVNVLSQKVLDYLVSKAIKKTVN